MARPTKREREAALQLPSLRRPDTDSVLAEDPRAAMKQRIIDDRLRSAETDALRNEELRLLHLVHEQRTEPGRVMPPIEREPRDRVEARLFSMETIHDEKTPIEIEHGDERRPLRDPQGYMILSRARAVDMFALMERHGTLQPEWAHAGRRFHRDFVRAQFDPLRAADLGRIASGGSPSEMSDAAMTAKNAIDATLRKLGGRHSPSASIVWSVAGEGLSIKDWAARQGWGGRGAGPRPAVAVGILVGALATLALHYDEQDEGARGRETQRHSSGSV